MHDNDNNKLRLIKKESFAVLMGKGFSSLTTE